MTYLLWALGLLLLPGGLRAQDAPAPAEGLDRMTRLEIQARLEQYLDEMGRNRDASVARLPVSPDVQLTAGYLRTLETRLKNVETSRKSLEIRWNNYLPVQQAAIAQDDELMAGVESFEMLKQEATDSLEVRKQMVQSLQDFMAAQAYMENLDTTYNALGKKAFELSLTSKTAPLLEREKKKEALLFESVQEKFDKAKIAGDFGLVSAERMDMLENTYAALKHKSDTIQQMAYKPLIARIKDYLLSLAAVAVLLMFITMLRAKIKAAKDAREQMKQYKEALKLNGTDEFPTI
jgi:hypothetical protein